MDKLLTSKEVSRLWEISPHTLRKWRWEGKGPQFVKLGHRVLYKESAIKEYIDNNSYSSTTEMSERKGKSNDAI